MGLFTAESFGSFFFGFGVTAIALVANMFSIVGN